MSVSNPGGGVSGKGGSFWTAAIGASTASTKVEGEIAEWRFSDDIDLEECTNFKSRDAGDTTVAVVDRVGGVPSMGLSIKGYVSTAYAALTTGTYIQVLLGVQGGATPGSVGNGLSFGPYVFRVVDSKYGNKIGNAFEFEATLESDSSRAVTA